MTGTAFLGTAPGAREGAVKAARRHSRFVRVLRIALPATAMTVVITIIAALALDPRVLLAEIGVDSLGVRGSKIVMQNPRFTGYNMDQAGQQKGYEVNAARAEQSLAKPHEVDLFDLKAKMSIRENGWASLDAESGHLNNQTEVLELSNRIDILTDLGDNALLSQARVEFTTGEISSSQPVRIEFSSAELDAGDMQLLGSGDRAIFTGGVRMKLMPDTKAPLADSPNRIGTP